MDVLSEPKLGSKICYQGKSGDARWEGRNVTGQHEFSQYMKAVVRDRVKDGGSDFESELRALATTGMATTFVEKLLRAAPEPKGWELGEALAECALSTDSGRQIYWPWNTVADRRTPRASLPGSDLVGFYREDDRVLLLFGEVKTSSHSSSPPNVMYGGSGMTWQLEESATRLDIHHTLLKWLGRRCLTQAHLDLYRRAVGRYLESTGKELLIVGVLIRDTQPAETDLKSRAEALAAKLPSPTRVQLLGWYLPIKIKDWPKLMKQEKKS